MKAFVSKEVVCPFYRKETATAVFCEGVEEDTSIKLIFPSTQKKDEYRYRCCKAWKSKCRIAQMLADKYKKTED